MQMGELKYSSLIIAMIAVCVHNFRRMHVRTLSMKYIILRPLIFAIW